MDNKNNFVDLVGSLAGAPKYSHSGRDNNAVVEYYTFPLEIARLSGTPDTVNITASKELLESAELDGTAERIAVRGELRTFNNKSGEGARLIISVFARAIELTDEEEHNFIFLRGTLCKIPNLRRTPMGREICDLMLAVNRRYDRSDYIPCIAWGRNATLAAEWDVSFEAALNGRLQSRKYSKTLESGETVERTAFEVSVMEFI
jgi:primosomal replication protein N